MTGQSDPSETEPSVDRTHDVSTDRAYEWTRTIIDELPQFVLVKDATRTHVLANEAVADAHGITVDQLEGTTDEQYVHEPDDRDYVADDRSVLETGEPIFIPEDRIVHADGTETIVKARLKRITGPAGEDQLLVVGTDITDEKRRERELEAQRDLLTKIERLGSTGGWELDPETGTVRWTEGTRHIFGVDEGEELTLEDSLSYFHPGDRPAIERAVRRCVETDDPYEIESRIVTATGDRRWVRVKGESVHEGSDRLLRGAISDITEQKQRELELQRQNDRLEEFAGVVAHDLRNPLGTARGYTDLTTETGDLDHLSTVRAALDRMDAIVDDTLTLAREGQTVGERSTIEAGDLATECWQLIETDGATVDCSDEFSFRGDPDRVQHVFENLFRNAVEHGPSTVTITVGRLDGDGFYIEDDGPGIPLDEREAVFDPGHTKQADGTGFGLAIVKRIAEAHGWSVRLTDAATGGARFEFTGVDLVD